MYGFWDWCEELVEEKPLAIAYGVQRFDETESFSKKETAVSDETHRGALAIPSYTHGSLGLSSQADSSIPQRMKESCMERRGPRPKAPL